MGLVGASLSLWRLVQLTRDTTRRTIALWLAASLLAVGMLLLNGLLILAELIALIFITLSIPRRWKMSALVIVVLLAGLAFIPPLRAWGFDRLATYTHASAQYSISRGLAWSRSQKFRSCFFPLRLANPSIL